jgi:hypothetical protein
MKNIIKLIITVIICSSSFTKVAGQQNFNGTWNWSSTTANFTVVISQVNNTVTGNHCSVSSNGERIDCAESTESSINGTVQGNSLIVTFTSSFSLEKGIAIIRWIDNSSIEWEITQKPKGDYFIPNKVILTKQLISGTFTMQPGVLNFTSSITNNGATVSFYLGFVPNGTLNPMTNYLIANISANCRPSVQRVIRYYGDKTWDITINPNGDMYVKIVCGAGGSCSPLNGAAGFGTITYPL